MNATREKTKEDVRFTRSLCDGLCHSEAERGGGICDGKVHAKADQVCIMTSIGGLVHLVIERPHIGHVGMEHAAVVKKIPPPRSASE